MRLRDNPILALLATLCIVVLLAYAGASQAVTIRTDPTPGATHCGLYKNGTFDADYPVANVGAGTGCLFVIDVQLPGTTIVYTATAVITDPVWGRTESPRSNPLSVPRPGAPTIPTWNATPVRAGTTGDATLRLNPGTVLGPRQ